MKDTIYYQWCCIPKTRKDCRSHFGVMESYETIIEEVVYFDEWSELGKSDFERIVEWARTKTSKNNLP